MLLFPLRSRVPARKKKSSRVVLVKRHGPLRCNAPAHYHQSKRLPSETPPPLPPSPPITSRRHQPPEHHAGLHALQPLHPVHHRRRHVPHIHHPPHRRRHHPFYGRRHAWPCLSLPPPLHPPTAPVRLDVTAPLSPGRPPVVVSVRSTVVVVAVLLLLLGLLVAEEDEQEEDQDWEKEGQGEGCRENGRRGGGAGHEAVVCWRHCGLVMGSLE